MTKKSLIVVVLMLVLVCALASCGGEHTHSYEEWETTKAATCTTEGIKERYCSCGEKQSATIPMTEHTYGEWEITKEATYTEAGRKKPPHHSVCHWQESGRQSQEDLSGHSQAAGNHI